MLDFNILKGTYTNEEVLIILLTRLYFGTQDVEAIHDFLSKEVVDWHVFYKTVSINDIRGFICEMITVSQIMIDHEIQNKLKKDAMAITLIAANLVSLKDHLIVEFGEIGIKAIPYKGTTLATRYYKSPSFREGSDLDLLVNKDEVPQLIKCLDKNGYQAKYNIAEHQMGFVMRFHRELSFQSPRNRMGISCGVELQWQLLENYFGQFHKYDFFVQHLESYTASDGTSRIGLAPTYDFLAVASHHLIREPLLKFKYLIDLACMVQTSSRQIDWEEINEQFKSYNFSSLLSSGINALEEILGIKIPFENSLSVDYHLFTATKTRPGRKVFFGKIKLITLKLSFFKGIELFIKTRLSILAPNLNDLSKTNAPAWTIPLIMPIKSVKHLYWYLTKKH